MHLDGTSTLSLHIISPANSAQPQNQFSCVGFLQLGIMAESPQPRMVFWNPFSSPSFLHGGRNGLIVVVSTNIVLKLPWRFEDDTHGTKHCKVKNSLKHFKYEKAMYEILNSTPHPNILQSFLSTADGIFLPRMLESLNNRLKQQSKRPVSEQERYNWIVQISFCCSVARTPWLLSWRPTVSKYPP